MQSSSARRPRRMRNTTQCNPGYRWGRAAGLELVFEVELPPVEGEALHGAARAVQHRAAGRLVAAPRLHAHKARLDDVDAPNACKARTCVSAARCAGMRANSGVGTAPDEYAMLAVLMRI